MEKFDADHSDLGFKGLKDLPPMNMELFMSLQDINFDCKFYIHLVILPSYRRGS